MEKLIIEGGCLQPGVDKELILLGGTDEDRLRAFQFDSILYGSKIVKKMWKEFISYKEHDVEKRREYFTRVFDLEMP